MLRTLKMIMRILGYTNRDIERKLGLSSSYLSRLFSGGMELRFDHIVNIGKAMGLTPEEVLQFGYPHPKEPTEAMVRLLTSTGALPPKQTQAPPPAPPAAPPSEQDLERLMARTLRKFFGEMAKVGEG